MRVHMLSIDVIQLFAFNSIKLKLYAALKPNYVCIVKYLCRIYVIGEQRYATPTISATLHRIYL